MENESSAKKGPKVQIWPQIVGHVSDFLETHKCTYPAFIYISCLLAVAMLLTAAALGLIHTASGELAQDVIGQIGVGVVFIFLAGYALLTFVPIARASVELATMQHNQMPQLTAVTVWQPPSISPDIFVCWNGAIDWKDEFNSRHKASINSRHSAKWAVIVMPLSNAVTIVTGDQATDIFFTRGDEPFISMLSEGDRVPVDVDHFNETFEQYQKYVNWFAPRFHRWATSAKLEIDTSRAPKTFFELTVN